jgi:hypothetical protein
MHMNSTNTYQFDGSIELHRGQIVKIFSVIQDNYSYQPTRVTKMENFTANSQSTSPLQGVYMANPPINLRNPIIGRVLSSSIGGNNVITFTIEEGKFEDYVFIRAGERKKARDVIQDIFKSQLDLYVKISDNYVNAETIKLLSRIPPHITILIISDNLKEKDKQAIQSEVSKLQNKVLIRKTDAQHDRFILTRRNGWSVGHSLKDLGSKNSHVQMMPSVTEAEQVFDGDWVNGTVYLEHNKGKT